MKLYVATVRVVPRDGFTTLFALLRRVLQSSDSQRKRNVSNLERSKMPNDWTNGEMYQTSVDATDTISCHWPNANFKSVSRRNDPTASEAWPKSRFAVKLMDHS